MPVEKILRIVWSTKTPLGKMKDEVQVSCQTAVDWYNFVRDVCALAILLRSPSCDWRPRQDVESKLTRANLGEENLIEGGV